MRNDIMQWPNLPQMGTDPNLPQIGDTSPDTPNDTSGFFANLMAKLDIGFNSVTSELRQTRKAMAPVAPVIGRQMVAIPLNGVGFGICRLAGPDQGHSWYVRALQVAGTNDPSVATPGRADVYVSAMDLRIFTSLAQIGIGDWRDMATALPNVAIYANGELNLRLNEELFIIISNGTANGIYTAACSYIDFQVDSYSTEWGL